jgi:hypothetical protein
MNTTRPICLTMMLVAVIAVLACSGGGAGGGSNSSGGGGSGPPPQSPDVLVEVSVAGMRVSPATAPQGPGFATLPLAVFPTVLPLPVPARSVEAATFDASGKQVSPITSTPPGASGPSPVGFNATVQLPTETPGNYTVEAWLIDTNGDQSNVVTTPIQVVATATYATLVTNTGPNAASLTQANGTLYWVESSEDALKSVAVSGGTATVLATRMIDPSAVVFFGSNVIWLDDRDGTVATCGATSVTRVLKQTASTGFTGVLASGPSCSGGASQIALIGTTIYWVSSTAAPSAWAINATPVGSGASSVVHTTSTPIVTLTANAGTLYWMENPYPSGTATIFALTPTPGGPVTAVASGFTADANTFAVDTSAVYYATPNVPATSPPTETLWAQPLAGGSARALTTAISTPVKVVSTLNLGGSAVVWMDQNTVNSVPAAGGAVTQLATTTGAPFDLLYDGTNVDWSSLTNVGQYGESGTISSVPPAGGAVSTVYQGGDAPRQLALDPQSRLNWTEGGPVGIIEGFARIARLGTANTAETVVSGLNAVYQSATTVPPPYPYSLPLVATSTSLLIPDQWRIKSISLAGGQLTTVAAPGGGVIGGLTTDGTSVYWDDAQSSVSRAPVGGGPITVLVPSSLIVPYAGGPGGPIVYAPDSTLYWAANDAASNTDLFPVRLMSTSPDVPATYLNRVTSQDISLVVGMAASASTLYFSDLGAASIDAVAIGPPSDKFSAPLDYETNPGQLTLDGATLYWSCCSGIYKATLNNFGSAPLIWLNSSAVLTSFALDSTYVYFVDGQEILRTPR